MEQDSNQKFLKNRRKLSAILKKKVDRSKTYDEMLDRISEYVLTKFVPKKKKSKSVNTVEFEVIED